jgi:isocitrate/isopropylmalate dehydrogenase
MMLDWLPGAARGGEIIRVAVEQFFTRNEERTRDLGGALSCAELGDRIVERIAA